MLLSEFIAHYRGGILDEVAGKELNEITEAVERHSRAGELKLVIKLKPKAPGEMSVSIKHEKKLPTRDTIESIMFISPENNLLNYDPSQPTLFENKHRSIENTAQKVRAI